MTKQWSEIMQEVDRLYHINLTSEGRVACITDYIIRLLNEAETEEEMLPELERTA
jgi:hypothetical protein